MAAAREWAAAELAAIDAAGLRRTLEPLEGRQGATVRLGGREWVNLSSNDYLGLAGDPRLAEAARKALAEFGVGSGASRLVVGDSVVHRALEERLAAFEHAEAALLFNGGYSANVGILSALLGPEDVVFSDALNHASLIDGCRLSRAKVAVFPHRDVGALAKLLRGNPGRRKLVCTDAVFSMDGDRAPLPELVQLCRDFRAALLVDEAHATGVLGARGAGLCEALGLEQEVDVRMGTLGKALGCFGAYAACAQPIAELLLHRARSFVFSTALPAAVCAAAIRAVELVQAEPERRERLWRNIRHFAAGLRALGHEAQEDSAVFKVVLGTPERAVEAAGALRARGLLVKAIRPPTVPKGTITSGPPRVGR